MSLLFVGVYGETRNVMCNVYVVMSNRLCQVKVTPTPSIGSKAKEARETKTILQMVDFFFFYLN